MTRRERLEAVINGKISEELIADCRKELEKLNAHCAGAKESARETARFKENKAYEKCILEVLGDEPLTVEEIGNRLNVEKLSRQRLTGLCTNLVREGYIEAVELRIKGKGKRRGYVRLD